MAAAVLLTLAVVGCETTSGGEPLPDDPGGGAMACAQDGECPPAMLCLNGFCAADVSCQNNGQCFAGLVCDETEKICRSCAADNECGEGKRCRDDGLCKSIGCNGDSDCAAGQRCDLETHQCVGRQPPQNGDGTCRPGCAANQVCDNGACVSPDSCSATRPCPSGFRCDTGRCSPEGTACQGDSDCPNDGCCDPQTLHCARCELLCPEGTSWEPERRMCTASGARCEANEQCAGGCCQPNGRCGLCDGQCDRDMHCARGYSCDTAMRRCVQGGEAADRGRDGDDCESSRDCVEGFRCFQLVNQQCRQTCTIAGSDQECARADYLCIAFANVCLPE